MKTYAHFFRMPLEGPFPSVGDAGHETRPTNGLYGVQVANVGYIQSFIRYGSFDHYHLFVPGSILKKEADLREKMLGKFSGDSRIELKAFEDFGNSATGSTTRYHAILHPEGPLSVNYLTFRNQQGGCKVPITGITHSIGYQNLLGDLALLLLAGPRPWDSIICTSESGRKAFGSLIRHVEEHISEEGGVKIRYDGRLDVIPLGTDTGRYQPRDKSKLRYLLGLPSNAPIVLWFGRFSAHDKADLQPLLIAFRRACEMVNGKKPILLMVGEDVRRGYADTIEEFAAEIGLADRVLIRKNPPLATGPLYYSASDIYVCPADNIQETFGQTNIEAMSSGLPVICSDWDGFRDTVTDNRVGFRIPTFWMPCASKLCDHAMVSPWALDHLYMSQSVCVDLDKMARAIATLVDNDQLRLTMGQEARKRALANFDWWVVIRKYEDLWDALNVIAAKSSTDHRTRSSWFRPSYFTHFNSYAATLASNATVMSSQDIVGLTATQRPPLPLHDGLTESILRRAERGLPVQGLLECGTEYGVSVEEVSWHVMRLLKYGCLFLAEEEGPNSELNHNMNRL